VGRSFSDPDAKIEGVTPSKQNVTRDPDEKIEGVTPSKQNALNA
jgi:hypothetical protein